MSLIMIVLGIILDYFRKAVLSLQFNCKHFKDRGQVSCLLNNSSQPQTTHAQPSTVRQLIYLVKTRVFSESQAFSNVFLKCCFLLLYISLFFKFCAMTLHYLLSRNYTPLKNLRGPCTFFNDFFSQSFSSCPFLMPPKAGLNSLKILPKQYTCISYCSWPIDLSFQLCVLNLSTVVFIQSANKHLLGTGKCQAGLF